MGRANELRRLIALAEQLRGPMMQQVAQVQNAVARRNDPDVQLRRRQARLARKRAWASRWMTVWALITAICTVFAVAVLLGYLGGAGDAVASIIIGLIAGTFAVRSGLKMRRLGREAEALGPAGPLPASAPVWALPPKSSMARQPMERLTEAEGPLAERLTPISRAGATPPRSVAPALATTPSPT